MFKFFKKNKYSEELDKKVKKIRTATQREDEFDFNNIYSIIFDLEYKNYNSFIKDINNVTLSKVTRRFKNKAFELLTDELLKKYKDIHYFNINPVTSCRFCDNDGIITETKDYISIHYKKSVKDKCSIVKLYLDDTFKDVEKKVIKQIEFDLNGR